MAEAKAAVGFSFNVTPDGVSVQYDVEAIKAIWSSGVQNWRMRLVRFKNHVVNSMHPAPPASFILVVAIVMGVQLFSKLDLSLGSVDYVKSAFPSCVSSQCSFVAALALGLCVWVAFTLAWRLALKLALCYHGWMYEPHGRMSLSTKLWMLLVKVLKGRRPLLYSYQASLPKMSVPSLAATKHRYLKSVRPLLDDAAYDRMVLLADEFFSGIATRLQRYVVLKSWWSTNYVSDWWEEYVYLRGRTPIMVNSNYYGLDALFVHPTQVQAARAGNAVHIFLKYRDKLDHEAVEPIMVGGSIPLCSAQYERMFNTTRIPGVSTDVLVHNQSSQHIVVYNRGRYFKVPTHFCRTLLEPRDLEIAFQKILDDPSEPAEGEEHLAALTAGERVPWATARDKHFSTGVNRASLDAIEKAAFILALDTEAQLYDPLDHKKLDKCARSLLHGKCYDRWFDKSFTLVIFANGRVGFNAEHSWADAPIMSQAWEVLFYEDLFVLKYNDDGHCRGAASSLTPSPVRLKWELAAECIVAIESSLRLARALASNVDLHILVHSAYGKRVMKKAKVSPDAYIQMALQLAYYRDVKKVCLTYESAMTRLFREGRTETVRSCTADTCGFVYAMEDPSIPASNKIALMRAAADAHQQLYRDAMTGNGIDRHLFCLYVVSKYLGIDSPFLKEVLSEPWRLSTSQTPQSMLNLIDIAKHPDFICAGGGFGPVSDDGYGVSYMLAGEDNIFFHISSKVSCPATDSFRFGQNIMMALEDMKALFA